MKTILNQSKKLILSAAFVFVLILPQGVIAGDMCAWENKSPACDGKCKPGITIVEKDQKCPEGTKAECCLKG